VISSVAVHKVLILEKLSVYDQIIIKKTEKRRDGYQIHFTRISF